MATEAGSVSYKFKVVSRRTFGTLPPSPKKNPPSRWRPVPPPPGFVTPVKLDRNDFIVWRNQVLTSIKGNGLERYINGECVCPGQFLPLTSLTSTEASTSTGSKSGEVNPEYDAWMKTDQQLLSWHMSTIRQNLLSTMIHCATAEELWKSLTIAGKAVKMNDFMMHRLTGLDSSDYESLVTGVLARGLIWWCKYSRCYLSDLFCTGPANKCKNRCNSGFIPQRNHIKGGFHGGFRPNLGQLVEGSLALMQIMVEEGLSMVMAEVCFPTNEDDSRVCTF
ncbi:hypothetical protein WN943_025656 [Citrus x changshan-huyou]